MDQYRLAYLLRLDIQHISIDFMIATALAAELTSWSNVFMPGVDNKIQSKFHPTDDEIWWIISFEEKGWIDCIGLAYLRCPSFLSRSRCNIWGHCRRYPESWFQSQRRLNIDWAGRRRLNQTITVTFQNKIWAKRTWMAHMSLVLP